MPKEELWLILILKYIMTKCHCAEICFSEILKQARDCRRPALEIAKQMGAAVTCTACESDLIAFVESELLTLVGHTSH